MNTRKGILMIFAAAALAGALFSFGFQGESQDVFDPQGRVLTQGRVFSFACRDFNGDGRLDIVISDYLNPARILFGDADLAFRKSVPLTETVETATTGHGVAVSDFSGDGLPDLFLVFNEFTPRILRGDGRGGFTDSGQGVGPSGFNGTSVRAADFDGDGDTDAVVTYYQKGARLYLNNGTGAMSDSGQVFPEFFEMGDLDGDGDLDALSLEEGKTVFIWRNDKGRFARREKGFPAGEGIMYLRLVDFDGDADLDFVALRREANSSLWENAGGMEFRKLPQELSAGTRLASGDIDRDGRTDLVVGAGVWLNRGGGKFENVQTVGLGTTASLGLLDIDGDGDLDLLGAGLERETFRADLKLFINPLPRR